MPATIFTPAHAYIPGKTDRHLEGYFDHVRSTAKAGMSPEELAVSEAFQTGLSYIESGYFWEAHEVLEPVWMALPLGGDARILVQALIQLANARMKLKMERPKAAAKLCDIVRNLLSKIKMDVVMSLEVKSVERGVDSIEKDINDHVI